MRDITVADYFVEFLIANQVSDVFCYQGGMVAHLFDSLGFYKEKIKYHECANEQGAALAACGFAQSTGKLGVAITTSGPGFTNALTGLANAWFDSIPLMLISGQVNTKDKRRNYTFRQYGFQELQACKVAEPLTKKTYEIDNDTDIVWCFDDAYKTAMYGRKGPVFLDFPINIGRNIISVPDEIRPVSTEEITPVNSFEVIKALMEAKRPVIIAGAGIIQSGMVPEFKKLIDILQIPVVTSLPAVDLLPSDSPYNVGFMGGCARRESGIVLGYCDCVLSLGDRLCNKSIGYNHEQFIPQANKFYRVDIDIAEFERQLKNCEEDIIADLRAFIPDAINCAEKLADSYNHTDWVNAVLKIKELFADVDITFGNEFVQKFTSMLPEDANITLDVGNNLIYGVQSSVVKSGTRIFDSAGLGSMGYSIPASVGVAIGNGKHTYAFCGDGGAQMNIQELNIISKVHLPIKIIVLNNRALAHIILFQEHYLDNRLIATTEAENDYYSCDFAAIAKAYGMRGVKVRSLEDLEQYNDLINDDEPALIEVEMETGTMLPNIHGGLDPLTNGPTLPDGLAEKVKAVLE